MRSCPPSDTRRRSGFTLVELLVGAAVATLLFVAAFAVFTWTWRGFVKGDDTVSSVYDASLLLLHVRRDVLRMELPEGLSPAVSFERAGPSPSFLAVDFLHSSRQLVPSTSAQPSQAESGPCEIASFYLRRGTQVRLVTYVYYPERRLVKRTGGFEGGEKLFSMPRLQEFGFDLGIEPEGTASIVYLPATTLGPPGSAVRPGEIWVRARVRVQSERKEGETAKTPIELTSLMFPKRLNRMLRSRWIR